MNTVLNQYRRACHVARRPLRRNRCGRAATIAIVDGPVDETRAGALAYWRRQDDLPIEEAGPGAADLPSEALKHGCGVVDRIRRAAPEARLYLYQVFSSGIRVAPEQLFAAMSEALKSDATVINVSAGASASHPAVVRNFRQLRDYAAAEGKVIVAATRRDELVVPAALPGVIAVRGEDFGGSGAIFVREHPQRMVVAHGGVDMIRIRGRRYWAEGSSFAAAEVAGIVARCVAEQGTSSFDECWEWLKRLANGSW